MKGRPVIYHIGPGVPPGATPQQIALAVRAAVYWMDEATARSPDGKVTVVIVRDPSAPRGGRLAYPRELAKILELNFPEALAKACVVPADGLFRGLWGVASRFVDEKTRQKINLLADQRELLRFVPYQELLQSLGGGNAYRFALGDVKGIPKEWADYHAQLQSQQFQQPSWGAQPQRALPPSSGWQPGAQAPPARPARRRRGRRAPGPASTAWAAGRPVRRAWRAAARGASGRAAAAAGAVRGASWSTTSGRARAASAVRRRDARLRRRRRGHAARRAARAGADGRRAAAADSRRCGTSRGGSW